MKKATSWKTTLAGAVTALGAYLMGADVDPAWLKTVGQVLMVVGPILLGFLTVEKKEVVELVKDK